MSQTSSENAKLGAQETPVLLTSLQNGGILSSGPVGISTVHEEDGPDKDTPQTSTHSEASSRTLQSLRPLDRAIGQGGVGWKEPFVLSWKGLISGGRRGMGPPSSNLTLQLSNPVLTLSMEGIGTGRRETV